MLGALGQTSNQDLRPCQGVVLEKATNEPVVAALIQVEGSRLRRLTDTLGRFSLPEVKLGSRLRVLGMGYTSVWATWTGVPLRIYMEQASSPICYDPVVTLSLRDAYLKTTPARPIRTICQGHIEDAVSRKPLQGASVQATFSKERTQTDSLGNFYLRSVYWGDRIEVEAPRRAKSYWSFTGEPLWIALGH